MANKQYLTFRWHNRQYAIEAMLVQELFPLPELTLIPEPPIELIGILNLRGKLVPVMHLDLLQGQPFKGCKLSDYVIAVQWKGLHFALVAHQVSEVLELPSEWLNSEIYDNLLGDINTVFISGVAQVETNPILLLDIKTLMSHSDDFLNLIRDAQAQLDIITKSSIYPFESSTIVTSDQDKNPELQPSLVREKMDELFHPLNQVKENNNSHAILSFYDLYCPNVTPEEKAVFRERADNL